MESTCFCLTIYK